MFKRLLVIAIAVFLASNTLVAQQNTQPHLYFFTNAACAPCKQVEPEIQLLISKGYPVTVVDTTQRPDIAQQFNVARTPTTILVADDQVAGRHAGLIDARTIVGWFQTANASRTPARIHGMTKPLYSSAGRFDADASEMSDTVHRGTRKPSGQAEFNALRATVRLIVKTGSGESVGTGTVIHSQNGECLVLTCGHIFRHAGNRSVVSADIGFEANETRNFPGRLISFDSGAKDIALVVIETGFDLPAVSVAPASFSVANGDQVFTLGCDHGQDATIRRTRIKRQSRYGSPEQPREMAKKYDIYGRSVVGRSGGGIFTADGQLIGVGNAAAVEVDEGIYTALENVHWQLAKVNLSHLFQPRQAVAQVAPSRLDARQQAMPRRVEPIRGIAQVRSGIHSVDHFSPTSETFGNSGDCSAAIQGFSRRC